MIVIQMYDLRPLVVSMPSLELYQGTQVLLGIELLDSVQNSKGRYNNIPLFKTTNLYKIFITMNKFRK